jgi:hypothetical protein
VSPGSSVEEGTTIRCGRSITFSCLIQLISGATRTESGCVAIVTGISIDTIGGADEPSDVGK